MGVEDLEPRYYLRHFEALLGSVKRRYGDWLNAAERRFVDAFEALPESARCLFVRLANRTPRYFRTRRLSYPEIDDLGASLNRLLAGGFVERLGVRHAPEAAELLGLFTRTELVVLGRSQAPQPQALTGLKKPELIEKLLGDCGPGALIEGIDRGETVVRRGFDAELEMLRFLFFGSLHQDMSRFVVRDLGHVRYERFAENDLSRCFATRRQAEDVLAAECARDRFEALRTQSPPSVLLEGFDAWLQAHPDLDAAAQPIIDKLALHLAALLERERLPESALRVYALSARPPARERRVRLLARLDRPAAARSLCETMIESPVNTEERQFALDFKDRLEGAATVAGTTRALRRATTLPLDQRYRGQVEHGVLAYFADRGWRGAIAENQLWRGLFGLLLWDILFDAGAGTFHHPFQQAPSDLYRPDFWARRQYAVRQRLRLLYDPPRCRALLGRTAAAKWGIANPLVVWHEDLLPPIEICCERLDPAQIERVLLEVASNVRDNGRGFPDLLLWDETRYRFVEVKSPTDRLSAQQLFWLQFFRDARIEAEVLKVAWIG